MSPPANPALPHIVPAHAAPADAVGALASLLQEPAPRPWRHAPTVAGVLAAHLAGGWALMQVDAVRQAVHEAMPLMVELLPAPAPPQQPPPPPPPPQRVTPPPKPAPIIVAEPTPAAPEPPVFEAPPPPVEPPPPVAIAEAAPPAPLVPPAPPAEPEMVAATEVRYLQPLSVAYPAFSKRRREAGRVMLLVRVSAAGLPVRVEVQQSSGFPRLDQAAVAAMRAARFVPLTRNGVPQEMMTLAPIEFELEN
jgi:protein TonB